MYSPLSVKKLDEEKAVREVSSQEKKNMEEMCNTCVVILHKKTLSCKFGLDILEGF